MLWYEWIFWAWMVLAVLNIIRMYFTEPRNRR